MSTVHVAQRTGEKPTERLEPVDKVSIRGVDLPLADLVDPHALRPESVKTLRHRLRTAEPFPHLVVDGLFNSDLLSLVAEEFDAVDWRAISGRHQNGLRSVERPTLGPASQLYFNTVYSGRFTDWLTKITGIDNLLTDPMLVDGGLHETVRGGAFDVHRDFQRHRKNGLRNEMVLITYLNETWQQEWGGQLELWSKDRRISEISPLFGRTLLMIHGPNSFHGHPDPLRTPGDRPRRSVAAYFYTSPESAAMAHSPTSEGTFLQRSLRDRAKRHARLVLPPALFLGACALREAVHRRDERSTRVVR